MASLAEDVNSSGINPLFWSENANQWNTLAAFQVNETRDVFLASQLSHAYFKLHRCKDGLWFVEFICGTPNEPLMHCGIFNAVDFESYPTFYKSRELAEEFLEKEVMPDLDKYLLNRA